MSDGTPDNTDTQSTVDPEEVDYEKRYKDTQSAYTTGQQTIKELKAELDVYKDLVPDPMANLPETVRDELDDLKYSDPDAWRVRLNEVETQERTKLNDRIQETTSKATSEAAVQFELSRRSQVLEAFNANSDSPLTDEQLANDIPPRLTRQLEEGKISFEDLIYQAHKYIHTGKSIKGAEDTMNQPNMNHTPGGSNSRDLRPEDTAAKGYEKSYY